MPRTTEGIERSVEKTTDGVCRDRRGIHEDENEQPGSRIQRVVVIEDEIESEFEPFRRISFERP